MKYFFLANDSVLLEEELGEQTEEQEELLAKEWICNGCGDSFATVQFLVTHSIYCPDAKALREGQQEPTEPQQVKEEEESPYRGDGDGEPNEILRHTLTEFPGVNKAVVEEVMSWADPWGYIPPHYLPYLLQHMKGVSQGTRAPACNVNLGIDWLSRIDGATNSAFTLISRLHPLHRQDHPTARHQNGHAGR